MAVVVRTLQPDQEAAWDRFVEAMPSGTFFHRAGWAKVIETAFGHATQYSFTERDGAITGVLPADDFTGANYEAFKIPQLRGVEDTAPYFHDNSAKTLEDVMNFYERFFSPFVILTPQDKADMVAYMKLLR